MTQPRPLSAKEILDCVTKALIPGGRIFPSKHFRLERMPQRNFDMIDTRKVLSSGKLIQPPTWNDLLESWNYDICGTDVEGVDLTIRIAIDSESNGVILVTGF